MLRSLTQQNYALFRAVLSEGTQEAVDSGLDYCQQVRSYPLSEAANPPATDTEDLTGKLVDGIIPYDIRFFEALDRIIQAEEWLPRDQAMTEIVGAVGIKKGETFAPTEHTKAILERAVSEAHLWIRDTYENGFPPFYPGTQWFFPTSQEMRVAQESEYQDPGSYPWGNRAIPYHMAFIGLKHLGAGQFYLVDVKDSDGKLFDSAKTYRMRVPIDVPVTQYWSCAMYDADSHAFIRENVKYSVSSLTPGLTVNDDGTVDIYVGPKAMPGLEANFIETGKSQAFELMFRFYGTKPEIFDQSWKLNDAELIAG